MLLSLSRPQSFLDLQASRSGLWDPPDNCLLASPSLEAVMPGAPLGPHRTRQAERVGADAGGDGCARRSRSTSERLVVLRSVGNKVSS